MASRAIWEIFPHFCGNANRRRLMMVMKAFNDESGKGESRTFVMAGFIARAEDWPAFEDDWNAVLAQSPAIPHFHMVEAVRAREFGRIKALFGVIRKHQFMALAVVIYMPDYEKFIREQISETFDGPYIFALTRQMELAVEWQIDHGLDEQMDFIFDEQMYESDHIQLIWSHIAKTFPDWIARRFVNRPIHLDDKVTPGLQAADMLAWSLRRMSEPNFPDFLDGAFEGITIRDDRWAAERLIAFAARIKKRLGAGGRLVPHDFMEAAQNRDVLYGRMNQAAIARAKPGQTVPLLSIPAKGIGRFLVVDRCLRSNNPHLHRRSGDQCLAEESA